MYNIEQLNESTFKNPELLAKINAEVNDLVDHVMAPEAYKMALELEQKINELASLQTEEPKIYTNYYYILIRLKFLSLLLWDNDTFLKLIKNYLGYILGSDIDINDRMTGKLYSVPDIAWFDIADQAIAALRENNQPIGEKNLIIAGEPAGRPPLIKYWILDYDRTVGRQRHENLERSQYFGKSKNYQNLNENDKIKIQQLLEFYDGLKPLPLPEEPKTQEERNMPIIAVPRQKLEGDEFRQQEKPPSPYFEPTPKPTKYFPPPTVTAKESHPPIPSKPPAAETIPQVPNKYPTRSDKYREEILPQDENRTPYFERLTQPTRNFPPPRVTQTPEAPLPTPPPIAPAARQTAPPPFPPSLPKVSPPPPTPPRPEPKLNGNIINLKEFGEK